MVGDKRRSRENNNNNQANKCENDMVEKKGKYFEWTCDKCGWGSRGYDEDAIISIKKRHDILGCEEFASEVQSKGVRIDQQ
jgi:hypothetical protein